MDFNELHDLINGCIVLMRRSGVPEDHIYDWLIPRHLGDLVTAELVSESLAHEVGLVVEGERNA